LKGGVPKSKSRWKTLQWVTKYIDFFFGNFHIWYIARFAPSSLWLHHNNGNENTVNLASLASSLFCTQVPMINLTGHALESLANQSGFKKADTLAAKQNLVHAIGKGSMHSPCFI
jgi:hypothetical protein